MPPLAPSPPARSRPPGQASRGSRAHCAPPGSAPRLPASGVACRTATHQSRRPRRPAARRTPPRRTARPRGRMGRGCRATPGAACRSPPRFGPPRPGEATAHRATTARPATFPRRAGRRLHPPRPTRRDRAAVRAPLRQSSGRPLPDGGAAASPRATEGRSRAPAAPLRDRSRTARRTPGAPREPGPG